MGLETLAIIGIAMVVAGGMVSAYGSIQEGKAQNRQAKAQAKAVENQVITQRQSAEFDAARIRERNRRIRGSQAAAGAKSGLLVGSGSMGDVMYDSSLQGELDVLSTMYRSQTNAAAGFSQATMLRQAGKDAEKLGKLNAGTTLLTAGGQAMSMYAGAPTTTGGGGGA